MLIDLRKINPTVEVNLTWLC